LAKDGVVYPQGEGDLTMLAPEDPRHIPDVVRQQVWSDALFEDGRIHHGVADKSELVAVPLQMHGLGGSRTKIYGDDLITLAGVVADKRQTHIEGLV
jgi:hypothetical protein